MFLDGLRGIYNLEKQLFFLPSNSFLISLEDLFAMEMDMIPKFSSKDEEIDFWKALSLKYKKGYVTLIPFFLLLAPNG